MGDMEKWCIAPMSSVPAMSSIPAMYEARDINSYDSGDIIKALGDEVDSVKALLSTELDKLDEALCGDDHTIG